MSDRKPGGYAGEPDRPEGEIVLEPTGPDDDDGSPDGPWDDVAMKAMVPSKFLRPYLSAGHASNSPAVLGHYGVTPEPGGMGVQPGGEAHVAEPQDFRRGHMDQGHADPSPADAPGSHNPHYAAASAAFEANRQKERGQHVMPSTDITSSPSSHGRAMTPSDMTASEIPHNVVVSASRAAPGEAR